MTWPTHTKITPFDELENYNQKLIQKSTDKPQHPTQVEHCVNQPRRNFMRQGVQFGVGTGALITAAGGLLGTTAQAQATASVPVPISSAIVEWSALELSNAIRTKRVSCVEVMTAYLTQIEAINPKVNAIVALRDKESLIKEAQEKDRLLATGNYQGWMHGMPQAIKDLTATKGLVTTRGSPLFKDFMPQDDAIIVDRVKKVGAIVIGKTNTPEFGLGSQTYNPVYGTTLNAYDTSKCAGGSSGGAAVSLALRMLPVADGSDMMGSLRNPGAFNNVFGFRPSQGRVPKGGHELFFSQMGYEGPMGRTVSDLAMLLATQAGFDNRDPLSLTTNPKIYSEPLKASIKGKKIAWMGNYNGYLPMEDGVLSLCESALKQFQAIGCEVEADTPKFDMHTVWQTWLTLRHFQIAGNLHGAYNDPAKRKLLKPEVMWEIEGGLKLSGVDVFKGSAQRSAWYRAITAMFQKYDYLVLPTAQVFPFDAKVHWPKTIAGKDMDTYHRWMEIVIGPTLASVPTLNVPVGFNAQGLPMGVSIMGKPQDDLGVLQLGYAYEQATNWVQKVKPKLLG